MKLVIDSGSSKAEWLVISLNGEAKSVITAGINPFFQQTKDIVSQVAPAFNPDEKQKITEVYFYGAGVVKGQTDETILRALEQLFPNATYAVNDDMLGAARALLGNKKGIACILGTGANSCLYSGSEIIDKVPTLGFILGDEGSGAYLGKIFLNHYFKRAMPADLSQAVETELELEWPVVLKAVYKEAYPSRYLARFSKFIAEHKEHQFMQEMLVDAFTAFIKKNVMRYKDYTKYSANFVGSVAYFYEKELKIAAKNCGVEIGNIIQLPSKGLQQYHK